MKESILFLVNPISGGINKKNFPALIARYLDHQRFDDEIRYWTDDKRADEMTKSAVEEGFDTVVAVGGDGTIHQVAASLKGSKTSMGIVPMGSGNGLARHLGVPLNPREAILRLNKSGITAIDTLELNGRPFVNMAGSGFDAHIGKLFAEAGTRGFKTYAGITLRELKNYRPQELEIEIDGKKLTETAFLISFANGSQWGNNAVIAPEASVSDGLMDVAIMKPFTWYQVPALAMDMFLGKIDKGSRVDVYKAKEVVVRRPGPGAVHLDGEPGVEPAEIRVQVQPQSLQMLL